MKRYKDEPQSSLVIGAMTEASAWLTSRVSYVEAFSALSRTGVNTRRFVREWQQFDVVELDHHVAGLASAIAVREGLGSLDAIHVGSAEAVGKRGLVFASWDKRLWSAAKRHGLEVLPERL